MSDLVSYFSIYNDVLDRKINFDLMEQGYVSDIILDQDLMSYDTGIKESNDLTDLLIQGKSFIDKILNNSELKNKAMLSQDHQNLFIGNNEAQRDLSYQIMKNHKENCLEIAELKYTPYYYSFNSDIKIEEGQTQNLLDDVAEYWAKSNFYDVNDLLFNFEQNHNFSFRVRELNLCRLNQNLLRFNACIFLIGSDPLFQNDLFDNSFFKKYKFENAFPKIDLKQQTELVLDTVCELCKNSSTLKNNALSLKDNLDHNLAANFIETSHFSNVMLSNVLDLKYVNNVFDFFETENKLNNFFRNKQLSIRNGLDPLMKALFNPGLKYLLSLKVPLKNQYYNLVIPNHTKREFKR